MTVNGNDLERIKDIKNENEYSIHTEIKQEQISLDLRGYRYEEAEKELDRFVEEAAMNKINNIRIIHGIGTGVIRKCIHEFFDNSQYIKKYNYEKGAGDNSTNFGVTIAYLK